MSLESRDRLICALEAAFGISFAKAFEFAEFLDNYIVDEIRDEMTDHIADMHDGSDNA